jgi:hypothetical protein
MGPLLLYCFSPIECLYQTRLTIGIYKRKITVEDNAITSAVHLNLRQSLLPNALGMFGLGLMMAKF